MALLRDRDGRVRRVRLLLPVDSYEDSDEETGTGGGPTSSDNMEERLARIERALRVPRDTARVEREVAQAATNAGPAEDELPHDEWRKLKDRIWRAARREREADWPKLSTAAKQKLGRIAGGMANSLAEDEGKFEELASDLVEAFDRMLREEQGPTPAPAAQAASGAEINLAGFMQAHAPGTNP